MQKAQSPEATLNGKRSTRSLRRKSVQSSELAAGEPAPSTSTPKRLPLPRRRGGSSKAIPSQSSPSPDELLLGEEAGKSSRKRRTKKSAIVESAMNVDKEHSPSPFGVPTLLEDEHPVDSSPQSAIPAPRLRASSSRVKVTDDPHPTATSAIATKAKFTKVAAPNDEGDGASASTARSTQVSSAKPGPGRSSSGFMVESTRRTGQKGMPARVRPRKKARARDDDGTGEQPGKELPTSGVDEGVPHDSAITSWESPARRDLLSASETGTATATNPPNFEQDADGEVDLEYMDDITADERCVAATTPELSP